MVSRHDCVPTVDCLVLWLQKPEREYTTCFLVPHLRYKDYYERQEVGKVAWTDAVDVAENKHKFANFTTEPVRLKCSILDAFQLARSQLERVWALEVSGVIY